MRVTHLAYATGMAGPPTSHGFCSMRAAGRSVGLPNVRIARGVPVLEVCRIATHTIVDHPVIVIVQIDSYPDHVALGGSVGQKVTVARGKCTTCGSRRLGRCGTPDVHATGGVAVGDEIGEGVSR